VCDRRARPCQTFSLQSGKCTPFWDAGITDWSIAITATIDIATSGRPFFTIGIKGLYDGGM